MDQLLELKRRCEHDMIHRESLDTRQLYYAAWHLCKKLQMGSVGYASAMHEATYWWHAYCWEGDNKTEIYQAADDLDNAFTSLYIQQVPA